MQLMQYPNVPHPIIINRIHNNYSKGLVGRTSPYPTFIIKILNIILFFKFFKKFLTS